MHDGYGYSRSTYDTTVRRLSWTNLGDASTIVFTIHPPVRFDAIAFSATGQLFAVGGSADAYAAGALYRTGGGTQHEVRDLPAPTNGLLYSLGSIAPWDGGR